MPRTTAGDIVIIGAGIAGLAAAYHLTRQNTVRKVTIIDALAPMSFTSAQSGENYRNWWPNQTMSEFIDHSIDLLEDLSRTLETPIRMTQSGYALGTRRHDVDSLLANSYGDVDVISNPQTIRQNYPAFDPEIRHVIHVRRAGEMDSHQLGQHFLAQVRAGGGVFIRGEVAAIEKRQRFDVTLADSRIVTADQLVVAAGPFVNSILAYVGEQLPVRNVLQQKLAFDDVQHAIPREQPFAIDLDEQTLDWTQEERESLASDERYVHLAGILPGNVHRRPDGGPRGRRIRLGWAYNDVSCEASRSPALDEYFPEIVLHAAARLNPALKGYYGRLPASRSHYGGYYTMTGENLPIIGPLPSEGVFVVAALSGFGTMAACAAGELCSRWVCGLKLPDYARRLSLQRYADVEFMNGFNGTKDRGVL